MYSRETVIILVWLDLPKPIKTLVYEQYEKKFGNDLYIEHLSELSPSGDGETWKLTLAGEQQFRAYYDDQCQTNNYKRSFDEFLEEYGLQIDWWLKDQPFDFTDVTHIFFKVSW